MRPLITNLIPVVAALGAVLLLSGCQSTGTEKTAEKQVKITSFYTQVMLAAPVLPSNLSDLSPVTHQVANNYAVKQYKTASEVEYSQANWQQRIAADWGYFDIPTEKGKLLIIDYQQQGSQLGYRYLANNTQNVHYEPWSSSKIQAFSGAVAKVRALNPKLGAKALTGTTPVADLISSVNSYEKFGQADGNSNAIASYFINLAGREYLTGLFHDDWLKLSDEQIFFRGAYASKVFTPSSLYWQGTDNKSISAKVQYFSENSNDPYYLSYRCQQCGLTGNKPMTTLAQAEWLKRLASHQREPLTAHPYLQPSDIDVLFNGTGHTDKNYQVGGMMQGISQMITNALAKVLAPNDTRPAKQILDSLTDGKWRVWQKIGWGPSGTRSQTETVMLAHIYLPNIQGGREFTLAAQNAVPGADEENLAAVGMQMQANFEQAFTKLLAQPN